MGFVNPLTGSALVTLSGLEVQGIVGASAGLAVIEANTPANSFASFAALPGGSPNVQIWNWIVVPEFPATAFGTGVCALQLASNVVLDGISTGDASDRIAGAIVPNGMIELFNGFGVGVISFLLVTPHA